MTKQGDSRRGRGGDGLLVRVGALAVPAAAQRRGGGGSHGSGGRGVHGGGGHGGHHGGHAAAITGATTGVTVGTATATGMAEDGAGGAPGSRGGSAPGCSSRPRGGPIRGSTRRSRRRTPVVHVSGGRPLRVPGLWRAGAAAPTSASGSGAWIAAAAVLVEPACPDARTVLGGHPSRVWSCAAVELRVRHRLGSLAEPGLPRWPAHDGVGAHSTRSVCR